MSRGCGVAGRIDESERNRYSHSVMKPLFVLCFTLLFLGSGRASEKPNILFIAIDDLNHWVGHLGRNSQAKTPNIDRLAAKGVAFTNAHTAVPACEPSRCATMGGRRPWTSGCYI